MQKLIVVDDGAPVATVVWDDGVVTFSVEEQFAEIKADMESFMESGIGVGAGLGAPPEEPAPTLSTEFGFLEAVGKYFIRVRGLSCSMSFLESQG